MRVAVLDDYQHVAEGAADWTRLAEHELTFFHEHLGDSDAVAEALSDFEVVCAMRERTRFSADVLERLPRLELLVTTGMANASIDLEAAAANGVTVCGTASVASSTVELIWALILSLARRIPTEDRAIRDGAWQTTLGVGLAGKTLAILGLGRLGTAVAKIGAAFSMQPITWSENVTAEQAAAARAEAVSKDELFRRADILTIHTRLSERTRGIVGAAELGLMKPSALLVNTSRGPIVNENALLAALAAGTIAGAALDVYDREPLPTDHPLRRAPNTVLTPHIGYATHDSYAVMFRDTIEDIEAFLQGQPVRVLSASN